MQMPVALVALLSAPLTLAATCPPGEFHDPVGARCVHLPADPLPAGSREDKAAPATPLARSLEALKDPADNTPARMAPECSPRTPQGRAACADGHATPYRLAAPVPPALRPDGRQPAVAACLNDLENASHRPDANALRLACGR